VTSNKSLQLQTIQARVLPLLGNCSCVALPPASLQSCARGTSESLHVSFQTSDLTGLLAKRA